MEVLKSSVESLAKETLKAHGLQRWRVLWDHARRRAGACNHKERTLSFSLALLPLYPSDVVRDVVLHEVAHALAGPRAGHGDAWKSVAVRLGATPRAQLPASLPKPPARWVGTCPSCGSTRELHRRPSRVSACGSCSPAFNLDYAHRWTLDGIPQIPPGPYAAELARLSRKNRLPFRK